MMTIPSRKVSVSAGRAWRWDDPVYKVGLYLFSSPHSAMIKALRRSADIKVKDVKEPPQGKAIEHYHDDGKRVYIIWVDRGFNVRNPEHLNTLVHEVMHITMTALMRRGLNADADHEEPYCYYAGSLFEQCYRLLRSR